MLNPAWSTIFRRKAPFVKLFDTRSDDSDLTTYTFTDCNLPDMGYGSLEAVFAYGASPGVLRTSGLGAVAVIVHGEDAATTFGVSSVTIGAVAGTERVDRGGATSAINTAIYTWLPSQLVGIPNSDIVVTWTEAIIACAIGVVGIYNIGPFSIVGTSTSQGTTSLNVAIGPNLTGHETHSLALGGATCAGAAGTEFFAMNQSGASGGAHGNAPDILYDLYSNDITYAAWWGYTPQYSAGEEIFAARGSFSGAAAGDQASIGIV